MSQKHVKICSSLILIDLTINIVSAQPQQVCWCIFIHDIHVNVRNGFLDHYPHHSFLPYPFSCHLPCKILEIEEIWFSDNKKLLSENSLTIKKYCQRIFCFLLIYFNTSLNIKYTIFTKFSLPAKSLSGIFWKYLYFHYSIIMIKYMHFFKKIYFQLYIIEVYMNSFQESSTTPKGGTHTRPSVIA